MKTNEQATVKPTAAQFMPAKFIETPQGDLIAPGHIASVKHWTPSGDFNPNHRVQIETVNGAVWELYSGPSLSDAIRARDAMKKKINDAISEPACSTSNAPA